MALKEYFVGSVGPLLYEDTGAYPDTETLEAFRGPQIYLENAPTETYHAARLEDIQSPGGSDTHVQFNDGGAFGGEDTFTYVKGTNTLTLAGVLNTSGEANFRADPSWMPSLRVDPASGRVCIFHVGTPNSTISLSGNQGHTIGLERNINAATAGQNLEFWAGAPKAGEANQDGGTLFFRSGVSTGTGTSRIEFTTSAAGSSGTADNNTASRATIDSTGLTVVGKVVCPTVQSGASAADLHLTTGTDKTVVLDTVVWDDLRVPASSVKTVGTAIPTFSKFKDNGSSSTGVFLYWFSPVSLNEVHFCVQMPHSWNGGDITPHVHWVPKATSDGNPANQTVEWGLEYTWAEPGATYGASNIIYAKAHSPADADVVANKHYMTSFAAITPTTSQDGLSSMLVCRFFRNATDGTDDTYEFDAGLLEVDFHFAKDTIGSRTISTK